jgi:hypothetical protein
MQRQMLNDFVDDELERIWQEMFVAYLNVLSR